jgi:16S rRNA (guanine(1405)-N(7))-methyltransferase
MDAYAARRSPSARGRTRHLRRARIDRVNERISEAPPVEAVLAALRRSRRYEGLAEPLLRRVAEEALAVERGRVPVAVKRAKRALHEIHGAFVGAAPPPYDRWEQALQEAVASEDQARICDELRRIMRGHASTRERLPLLGRFFREIFARTGAPSSLVDVACGLNPLAAPWMDLPEGVLYHARDVDAGLVTFVDRCLTLLGVRHETAIADLLDPPPWPAADVGLVLKTVPVLEQQAKGAGFGLVERLRARTVVVSFPTRSLGGHGKRMAATYSARFEGFAAERGWAVEKLDFPGELVYVVRKPL